MTLVDLSEAFLDARSKASDAALYTTSNCPTKTCRYCGKCWLRHVRTKNDGHSKCLVTVEFRTALCRMWWSTPSLTRDAIADALGVSKPTVSSWTSHEQMRLANAVRRAA